MEYKCLEEICTDIIDCPHSTPKWLEEGIPAIRNYNLVGGQIDTSTLSYVDEDTYLDRIKRGIPEPDDIIISREAPMGMVAIIPEGFKCCLGQRLVLLKVDKQKCNPHYLLYAMMSDYVQSQIKKADLTGSIVSNLNIPDLKALSIPMIEREEQDKVADLLSLIDEKILNLKTINESMQNQIRFVYDYWFMQYDFPSENEMPYRSSGGEMIYDDVLGSEIPKGWKGVNLLDVVSWNGGSQPPKSEHINKYREGYVRFIQNRDYAGNDYLTYIPIAKKNKLCNEYDIMIDKYGDAGKTRFGIDGAYNVALSRIGVSLKNGQEYIRRFLESDAIKQYLAGACMASTRASLNEANLSFLKIVVPDEKTLEQFENYGKMVIDSCLNNNKEIEGLKELKMWLLPLLINGQVFVKE